MMGNIFLVSDTHFGHHGVTKFLKRDGSKLRPWDTIEEMDEAMVELWNSTVRPCDKVYHIGDAVINRRALQTLGRLNGDKVLIKGNHDIFRDEEYAPYFRSVRAYHVLNGMILSHIPIHDASIARFGTNIHGHLHDERVRKAIAIDDETREIVYGSEIDERYLCVCVEQTDFRPIAFEEVQQRIRNQGGTIGFRNGNGPTM